MAVSNHLFPNIFNRSGVHSLALFICHLFVGGNFRVGHILYDPKVFDGQLTVEIDSVCSVQIPWQTNDVTQSPFISWDVNERNDHILQLIFFDPNKLPSNIQKIGNLFTFYRVFIFSSIPNEIELKRRIFLIGQMNPILNSSTLILHYNSDNGSINVHLILEKNPLSLVIKSFNKQDTGNSVGNKKLFDQTFGKYEQKQLIAINAPMLFREEKDYSNHKRRIPNLGHIYHANFFLSSLNATYLNLSCTIYSAITTPHYQVLTQKRSKYYKELNLEFEPIRSERLAKLEQEHINNLYFGSFAMGNITSHGIKTHSLYPYGSIKLAVMFVYGTDFDRRNNITNISASIKISAVLITLFMGLATYILLKVRSKLNLRRADISSAFIDVLIAFIACGNLRMRHKIERWFFAILLTGALFMTPISTSELLNEIYRMQDQTISTFEQLAKVPAPIYTNPNLAPQVEQICELLRQKLEPNINYKGAVVTQTLAKQQKGSFIYVAELYRVANYRSTFVANKRDFDVIQEKLGSVNKKYFLRSDHYIPERLLKKIDRMTSSIMENGMDQFYLSFTTFQRKLFEREYSRAEESFHALSMNQLKRPMIVLFGFWAFAIIVLIVEKAKSKWKNHSHIESRADVIINSNDSNDTTLN